MEELTKDLINVAQIGVEASLRGLDMVENDLTVGQLLRLWDRIGVGVKAVDMSKEPRVLITDVLAIAKRSVDSVLVN